MSANSTLRHRPFAVVIAVSALSISLAIGCGGRKAKISGNVTLDGKPLPAGTITFHASKGKDAGAEIVDGRYTVTAATPGEAKVTVDTAYLKVEADALGQANQNMAMSMGHAGGGNMPPEAKEALAKEKQRAEESQQKAKELRAKFRHVPDKYTKADSSPISFPIKAGNNTFDVDLSSK